jgi:hypothetical protein
MTVKLVPVAAAAVVAGAPASAQWVGRSWDSNRQLTYRDVEIIRNTAQREVHDRPADTVAVRTDPATGHSGTIALVRKFVRRGTPCEQIEYRIITSQRSQRTHHYVFNSCRQQDGSWTSPPGLCGSPAGDCAPRKQGRPPRPTYQSFPGCCCSSTASPRPARGTFAYKGIRGRRKRLRRALPLTWIKASFRKTEKGYDAKSLAGERC